MEEKTKLIKERQLEETYIVVYTFKNEVTIKTNDKLITKNIYTLIGLNTLGNRTVLDIVIEDINDNHFWLDTFESLKARGLKQIYFICIANNKNIDRALKMTLSNTKIITSLTDIITLIYKYVGYRGRSTFIKQIKELYVQDTIEQFNNRFELLKEKYSNNFIVSTILDNKIINIDEYYKYDINIRNLLFNHNKCIEIYDKISKYKNYINNINEMWEYLYESIVYMEQFKSYTKNNWVKVLNSLIKYFPDSTTNIIKE